MFAAHVETVNGLAIPTHSWIAFIFLINELLALNISFG